MAKYDTKTMYNFEKYLALQKSGELNMVSPEVQSRLGITKEEHLFILEHYSELLNEYEELKVVDELIDEAKARVEGEPEKERSKDFNKDFAETGKEE